MHNNSNFTIHDEIVDLEWFSKNGHQVPKGRKYRILINDHPYIVHQECMTGAEILALTGKTPPDRFQLRQKFKHGAVVTIPNNKVVCFTEPGIEKFKTLPMDQTEGECPRRAFSLLEEDTEYLDSLGLLWETIQKDNQENWVLIHDYPIPEGYNTNKATLAVRVTPTYPTAQLDMVYFCPKLSRKDGRQIGALTDFMLDGKMFQQWSRHRTPENSWRVGIDNLSTHIPLADIWLNREFKIQPSHEIPA